MQVSKFTPYSLGIVAVNKPLKTDIVEVTPVEHLTMLDGELNDHIKEVQLSSNNFDGSSYETLTKQSATLKCRWLPNGSNRITSPDVRRGEQVMIWKFGDADRYYWSSLEYEKKLRKLETVVFGISATKDEDDIGTPDSMYYLEISSHKKLIHFHTSKANDEPFAYDLQLNTKDGYLLFTDDVGNLINLDSENTYIELTNEDGTTVQLDKKNLLLDAPDYVDIKAGKELSLESPKNFINGSFGVKGAMSVSGMLSASGVQSSAPLLAPSHPDGSGHDSVDSDR